MTTFRTVCMQLAKDSTNKTLCMQVYLSILFSDTAPNTCWSWIQARNDLAVDVSHSFAEEDWQR